MLKKILLLLPLGFLVAMFMLDLGNKRTIASDEKAISGPFETIVIGQGGDPKWSPDGNKISFLREGWLWVTNSDNTSEPRKVTQTKPMRYEWISDSTFGVQERDWGVIKNGQRLRILRFLKVYLDGTKEIIFDDTSSMSKFEKPAVKGPIYLPGGAVVYYKYEGGMVTGLERPMVVHSGTLSLEEAMKVTVAGIQPHDTTKYRASSGDVALFEANGTLVKKITNGQLYMYAILSPDGQKIAAGRFSAFTILDLDGHETLFSYENKEVIPGVMAGMIEAFKPWSPDSRYILYQYTGMGPYPPEHPEDEGSVMYSEIFLLDIQTGERIQITDTPDEYEERPSWSPDGSRILCRSSITGKIFVLKIK